jgi:hypothetical protein
MIPEDLKKQPNMLVIACDNETPTGVNAGSHIHGNTELLTVALVHMMQRQPLLREIITDAGAIFLMMQKPGE